MDSATSTAAAVSRYPRVLGRYDGQEDGALVLCLGGIHGNEAAGVHALERVFEVLHRTKPQMRGTLVGLVGNLRALEVDARFLDHDLNRVWLPDRLASIHSLKDDDAENIEQRDLLDTMRNVIGRHRREVYFVDLHTSSAEGPPFACIGDTIRNRRFAQHFLVPVILGLEEQLEGALLEYLNNLGVVTLGFEGGEHYSDSAVDYLEAGVWRALVGAGCLDEGVLPEIRHASEAFRASSAELPRWLGIRYRHAVAEGDGFRMRPGYRNFRMVSKGEVVAEDRASGKIETYYRARILLPLYQGQGDDGFFLALNIRPAWLAVSRWMRRLRLDRIVHWMPGVSRVKGEPGAIRVNRRVARWATVEIFHLLGFRKRRIHGDYFIVRRRKFDLKGPDRVML